MRTTALILAVVILGAGCCQKCTNPTGATTKYARDTEGRIAVWHGANVSNWAKHGTAGKAGPTWHGPEDFRMLRDTLGFNCARLQLFWESLEPQEGVLDTLYLFKTMEKVREMQACSLDVIVDMHQDLYAQRYLGDGFPDWTIKDTTREFKPNTENWALMYLQPAVLACFDDFWGDPALQDKYMNALRTFVQALDTFPAVVGYDVFNEPFPGTKVPAYFEENELSAFYVKALATIRAEGSRKLMFFEPWMSASIGMQTYLKFKPDSLCVFAPHYYNEICERGGTYNPCQARQTRDALKLWACQARNMGVPMLIGEFGIRTKSARFYGYLMDFGDYADQYGISWTYWSYDRQRDSYFGLLTDSTTPSPQALALYRVYPERIAGDNPSWWYNGKKFELQYDAKGLKAPTVINIPKATTGVVVKVDGKIVEAMPTGGVFAWPDTLTGHRVIEVTHD